MVSIDGMMAYDAGCSDYIAKPTSQEEMLDKLRKYGVGK
jgi:DNA-binding response OmpR family regulator